MDKTFLFIEVVWSAYVAENKTDIRYIDTVLCSLCRCHIIITFRHVKDDEPSDSEVESIQDGTALPDLCDSDED